MHFCLIWKFYRHFGCWSGLGRFTVFEYIYAYITFHSDGSEFHPIPSQHRSEFCERQVCFICVDVATLIGKQLAHRPWITFGSWWATMRKESRRNQISHWNMKFSFLILCTTIILFVFYQQGTHEYPATINKKK